MKLEESSDFRSHRVIVLMRTNATGIVVKHVCEVKARDERAVVGEVLASRSGRETNMVCPYLKSNPGATKRSKDVEFLSLTDGLLTGSESVSATSSRAVLSVALSWPSWWVGSTLIVV